jgi:glucosamine 6-phosphate synthetase-like amidotransferase/phosphosugar isomerase protein
LARLSISPKIIFKGKGVLVGTAIDYQKVMTEIVYINLPGPAEPTPGMSGGELLHGFLADLYRSTAWSLKTTSTRYVSNGMSTTVTINSLWFN